MNKCPAFIWDCHNDHTNRLSYPRPECTCAEGQGCNKPRTHDCACGWDNTWTDSGDRGAARHHHENYDCPLLKESK